MRGWLPDQSELITADARRLISVTVTGKGADHARPALARALPRLYLAP